MENDMPVFVKIDEYKEVLDTIANLQKQIADAKALLGEIDAIKHDEESELESWKMGLEDVEEKISNLNGILSHHR